MICMLMDCTDYVPNYTRFFTMFSCTFSRGRRVTRRRPDKQVKTTLTRMFNQKPPLDHPPTTLASFLCFPLFLALDGDQLWSTVGSTIRALKQVSRIFLYPSTDLLSSKHDQLSEMRTLSWRRILRTRTLLAVSRVERNGQPRLLQLIGKRV